MSNSDEIKKGDFIKYLEKMKPEIDGIIEKYIPKNIDKKWLEFTFGVPRYSYSLEAADKSLVKPTWDFISRGGKRWRPILFLLITQAVNGDMEKIKDIVIIPELIHNGTIIIDDIEDDGELRRGKPVLHKIFGIDIALNAGNFLYFFPLLALSKNRDKFKPEILVKAYETYIQEMINLSLGQGTDIYWHRGGVEEIKEEEYLQMCAFKTGCLSRMSAKLAVILAGASDELTEAAGKVAEAMGVAFQIQDDILDIVGEKFAKGKGGLGMDITEGKRTLMVIHTLKNATEEDRKRLIEILNKHTDDKKERTEAIEIIKKYGSIEYAQKRAREIMKQAWAETDKLLVASPAKERLNEFVNYLIERKI